MLVLRYVDQVCFLKKLMYMNEKNAFITLISYSSER